MKKHYYEFEFDSGFLFGSASCDISDFLLDSILEAFLRSMDYFCHGDFLYKMYSFPCGSMRGIEVKRIPLRYADRASCYMYEDFWQSVFSGFFDEDGGIDCVP